MEMSNPYPIKSKLDPTQKEADKDYSMTSPLLADGSNFPCKGQPRPRLFALSPLTSRSHRLPERSVEAHHGHVQRW